MADTISQTSAALRTAADAAFAAGRHYEATQRYTSVVKRLQNDGDVAGAAAAAEASARALSEAGCWRDGRELLELMFGAWRADGREATDELVAAALALAGDGIEDKTERVAALEAASAWAAGGAGADRQGPSALHARLAEALEECGRRGDAAQHLARTDAPGEAYAALARRWADRGYASERDLFVCRATLHLLSRRKREAAAAFWSCAREDAPTAAALESPLGHLTGMLLLLAEELPGQAGAAAFSMVRARYGNSLRRCNGCAQYVQNIGEACFGIRPNAGMGGMIGEMMKNMFSG